MDIVLTPNEKKLVEHAKEAIVRYNKQRHARGGIDTLYAFLISESGTMYDGAAFEPNVSHATVCGERHAIAKSLRASQGTLGLECGIGRSCIYFVDSV